MGRQKKKHRKWQKIDAHLEAEAVERKKWMRQIDADKTPERFQFFPFDTTNSKALAQLGCGMAIGIMVCATVYVILSGKSDKLIGDFGYNVLLILSVWFWYQWRIRQNKLTKAEAFKFKTKWGITIGLGVISALCWHYHSPGHDLRFRERGIHLLLACAISLVPFVWHHLSNPYHWIAKWFGSSQTKKHANRLGIYIGQNHLGQKRLIYQRRHVKHVIRPAQIEKMTSQKDKSLTLLVRNEGQRALSRIQIAANQNPKRAALIDALLEWKKEANDNHGETESHKRNDENWTLKMQEVYRFRHWLPKHIIDAIPEASCSMAERMQFIERIKPYQFRMKMVDEINTGILFLFGMANLCLVVAIWTAMLQSDRGEMWSGYFTAALTLPPVVFYGHALLKWRAQKQPALGYNVLWTVYFISLMALSGAQNVLEWGADRNRPNREIYSYKVAFSGRFYGEEPYLDLNTSMTPNSRQEKQADAMQTPPKNVSQNLILWAQGTFEHEREWNSILTETNQIASTILDSSPQIVQTQNKESILKIITNSLCKQYQFETTPQTMTIQYDKGDKINFPLQGSTQKKPSQNPNLSTTIKTRIEGLKIVRTIKQKDISIKRRFTFTEGGVEVRYSFDMKYFAEPISFGIQYKQLTPQAAEKQ